VDILVSNAGVYVRCPIKELTVSEIERSMAVNFYGGLHAILAVLPHMLGQRSGHIVLVTSMDARIGLPLDAPYVAAKFALRGLGEVLRQELHHSGIKVTTVFPGRVDTPMIADLKVPSISAKIPPEAVAQAIVNAIRRQRPHVIVPGQVRLLDLIATLSPRLSDWLTRYLHLEGWKRLTDSQTLPSTD
jgi:short-subunit dehydrogenase